LFSSPKRLALTLGLFDAIASKQEMVAACRKKLATINLLPPVMVETGPVADNLLEGSSVDLLSFPAPRHHELDGGRYIGTANCVITQDPDEGWVNLGTYRCMVLGRDKLGLHMSPGRDGGIMRGKYFARNQPMPIAVAIGVDPALWLASNSEVRWGTSEYDYAGGLKQQPIEVMRGPRTGLPIPARAEIVIEGMCHPGELELEGPFGEWAGYYANRGLQQVPENVVRVLGVMHRDDPILTCAHPAKPKNDSSFSESTFRSATMWDEMEPPASPAFAASGVTRWAARGFSTSSPSSSNLPAIRARPG
jgi:4-hydroxy-3-polyprenylbenzoate decarboxylase